MSTALARAEKHLELAVVELEVAKAELPDYSLDAATLLSVDVRAAVRQIGNMLKVVGDRSAAS